jgi:hypothetical protein
MKRDKWVEQAFRPAVKLPHKAASAAEAFAKTNVVTFKVLFSITKQVHNNGVASRVRRYLSG